MNATCPACNTVFRVDPRKIPNGGISARCSICSDVFRVASDTVPASTALSAASPVAPPAPAPTPAPQPERPVVAAPVPPPSPPQASPRVPSPTPASTPFGAADPDSKARRLARALVSDMAVYHPDRRDRSLESGTLKQEFREEIRKSWEEYVSQVGTGFARETPHFRDALNEILARGQKLF
jgi:predicted Zn finger-like uncharacterized protein